jgi:serine/threonine-protein kinase
LALSPDASLLAYVATQRSVQQIYLRAMDEFDASPITGTEGATDPSFSPDGQWLGFIANGKLKKISIRGGVAQELTEIGTFYSSASWASEHTIAFAPYSSVLQQVSDEGGTPQPMTRFEKGETLHMWPQFLPGGKAFLFTVATSGPTGIAVQKIGGERRTLIPGQGVSGASYVLGRVIYVQAGNLMAVPFDPDRLQTRKGFVPAPVISNIMQYAVNGAAQYTVSATGSLAYVLGSAPRVNSELVWVDRRDQKEYPLGTPARPYNQPRLSPDNTRVAVDVVETTEKMQVWLWDLARGGPLTPFTFDSVNRHAVWTPDSKRLVFMSNREGPTQIFWQLADGTGGLHRLTNNRLTAAGDTLHIPYSISRSGIVTFIKLVRPTEAELWALPVGALSGDTPHDGQEQRLPVQRAALDGGPQLSPDGRWLAYASDESGQRQIYVQAFYDSGGKQQISTDGGNEPQWNPNGRELFYRSGDKMLAVAIDPQGIAGKAHVLFHGPYLKGANGWVRPNYDVSADGQRLLMLKPVGETQTPLTEINVVLNWAEELKRLVPAEDK